MSFHIQRYRESSVLTTINDLADGAVEGGAVFAFATQAGVDSFFGAPNISEMLLQNRRFSVIVGFDAITNSNCLKALTKISNEHGEYLDVKAFIHSFNNGIFHPKFAWFCTPKQLKLLCGSGNLTLAGLGDSAQPAAMPRNWEAFTVSTFAGSEREDVFGSIQGWLSESAEKEYLTPLDDSRVIHRAIENDRSQVHSRRSTGASVDGKAGADFDPHEETPGSGPYALVREIPKNRPGQADVGKSALEFFGYTEGRTIKPYAQRVEENGHVRPPTISKAFRNKSKNYRLELDGLGEEEFQSIGDNDERTIIVAVRFDKRSYRYALVPVGSPNYAVLSNLLGPISSTRNRPMRQKFFDNPEDIESQWADMPQPMKPGLPQRITF